MKKICKIGFDFLLSMVVVYLLLVIFSGCSAKKKNHQSDLEEVKIENSQKSENSDNSDTNVKLDIKTKVDEESKVVSTIKTWSPFDPTKPASMTDPEGKKHDLNNAIYQEQTTTEQKSKKTETADNSNLAQKKRAVGKAESKGSNAAKKEVVNDTLDRSGFNFWAWLWMAGLIIVVIVLFYLNNRFNLIKRVTAFFSK